MIAPPCFKSAFHPLGISFDVENDSEAQEIAPGHDEGREFLDRQLDEEVRQAPDDSQGNECQPDSPTHRRSILAPVRGPGMLSGNDFRTRSGKFSARCRLAAK